MHVKSKSKMRKLQLVRRTNAELDKRVFKTFCLRKRRVQRATRACGPAFSLIEHDAEGMIFVKLDQSEQVMADSVTCFKEGKKRVCRGDESRSTLLNPKQFTFEVGW